MYKLLVVDDIRTNRIAVKLSLSELIDDDTIEILEAENGLEAIKIAKKEKPLLIFMDVMMPIMDGIEASQKIKEDPDTQECIIIGITALDDAETKNTMIDIGVKDFLNKPFNSDDLLNRVNAYLSILSAPCDTSNTAIQSRESNIISLYEDKNIKSHKIIFNIFDSCSLLNFWQFFDTHHIDGYAKLFDYLNFTTVTIESLIEERKISDIAVTLEEAEDCLYLTIQSSEFITALIDYISKFAYDLEFKEDGYNLTFNISKDTSKQKIKSDNYQATLNKSTIKKSDKDDDKSQELNSNIQNKLDLEVKKQEDLRFSVVDKISAQEFVDELDDGDFAKLEDFKQGLDGFYTILNSLFDKDANTVYAQMDYIAEEFYDFYYIVSMFRRFDVIERAFQDFSEFIKTITLEQLKDNDKKELLLDSIFGITDDLSEWIETIFYRIDTDNIHYLDASLSNTCLEIEAMFSNKDVTSAEDEDDLDFF